MKKGRNGVKPNNIHPVTLENNQHIVRLGLLIIRLLFIKYQRLKMMFRNEVKEIKEKQ